MRRLLALVTILSLAGGASARQRQQARPLEVQGKTLQVSAALKQRIDDHQRQADWTGKFSPKGANWLASTRFHRLRDGTASADSLHIGQKAASGLDSGQKWLVRLSQKISAPPPPAAQSGLQLALVRAGPQLGSRVFGATHLPNGGTLEVTAEILDAKKQVRFQALTGTSGTLKRTAPTGRYIVRDAAGKMLTRGNVRDLWRKANSPGAKAQSWTTSNLGLSPEALKEMLVDLTD